MFNFRQLLANTPVKWMLTLSFFGVILMTSILLFGVTVFNIETRLGSIVQNHFDQLAHHEVRDDLNIAVDVFYSEAGEIETAIYDGHLVLEIRRLNREDRLSQLPQLLLETASQTGLDFLTFVSPNGEVIARRPGLGTTGDLRFHPIISRTLLADSYGGLIIESSEMLAQEGLALPARIELKPSPDARPTTKTEETRGMLLEAATKINAENGDLLGILWGGILLNHNTRLVQDIGNLMESGTSEMTVASLFLDDLRIATEVIDENEESWIGTRVPQSLYEAVILDATSPVQEQFLANVPYVVAYQPLHDVQDNIVGMIGVGVKKEKFTRPAHQIIASISEQHSVAFVVGFLVAVVLATIGALWFSKFLSRPIQDLAKTAEHLADGDLRFHTETVYASNELSVLGLTIRKTVLNLTELVGQLQDASQKINQIVDVISDAVQKQGVSSTEQSTAVTETTSTMEELAVSSKQIAQSSDAVVEIAENTQADAQQGVGAMDEMLARMEEIQSMNERSIGEIQELSSKTKRMQAVMNIINDVADRTKLIAFNASLEAEAAGESGKRFRVVATEIRRLAENVTESTDEIRSKINEIQNASSGLIVASEETSKKITHGTETAMKTAIALQNIMQGVEQTTSSARQISLATQQQRTASEQVVQSLREVSAGIQTTVSSIKQTESIVADLRHLSEQLATTVDRFTLDSDV